MQYKRFEDLPVWQEARVFVKIIYSEINTNKRLGKDYSLCDQLKRSAYSILLNVSEGFERGSNKEFANFLNISKGSAGEVRSILYILLDLEYIGKEKFNELNKSVQLISSHLSHFRQYLRKNLNFAK